MLGVVVSLTYSRTLHQKQHCRNLRYKAKREPIGPMKRRAVSPGASGGTSQGKIREDDTTDGPVVENSSIRATQHTHLITLPISQASTISIVDSQMSQSTLQS